MILRRVTKHIKDQNWFAVALDFVIVVIGVGVAMMGQQWIGNSQQRADMRVAEAGLQLDLFYSYFNAKERLAISACRRDEQQAIAAQLLASGENWTPMPKPQNETIYGPALAEVLRSPQRFWGSRTWEAGLARGTFNQMNDERREKLDGIFQLTQYVEEIQFDIYTLQGRMKMLAVTTTISQGDRARYFEMLGELDAKSTAIEDISGEIIALIEALGIDAPIQFSAERLDGLPRSNQRNVLNYGDCVLPIELPVLEKNVGRVDAP